MGIPTISMRVPNTLIATPKFLEPLAATTTPPNSGIQEQITNRRNDRKRDALRCPAEAEAAAEELVETLLFTNTGCR